MSRELASLVLDTHDLGRRAGAMLALAGRAAAPEGLGVGASTVTPGSGVDLDLRLEAVIDGVLVSGTATVSVVAECSRCLDPIVMPLTVELQDLYLYPDRASDMGSHSRGADGTDLGEDGDIRVLDDEAADLEPALRDAVVPELPLVPLCRIDCPGLCPQCGVRLAEDPEHRHQSIDPRWTALVGWDRSGGPDDQDDHQDQSNKKGS